MLATAHVEWASGEVRILETPGARIAFRFTTTVAGAFVAAEDGTKATGTVPVSSLMAVINVMADYTCSYRQLTEVRSIQGHMT